LAVEHGVDVDVRRDGGDVVRLGCMAAVGLGRDKGTIYGLHELHM
jgi:hypothetical protein